MTIQIIEEIRNCIANNKLDIAIELFRQNCSEYSDELILQSSKFKRLKSDSRKGIISREQSNIENNILCNSLLELLNEIDCSETEPKNERYSLNSELRDILGFAELISRRKNKERTSTRDFFTALVTINPDSLIDLINELNSKESLPQQVNKGLLSLPRKLSNNRTLSGCLTESLHELSNAIEDSENITPEDMFIDVSKYGRGNSVEKLREKGIGVTELENYVDEFKLKIHRRK